MTYAEAKTVVNSGPFNSCYDKLSKSKKKFKELYDSGPFKSATRTFEDIKNDEQAFRSGDTNIYYTLVENYENDLNQVYNKVAGYLNLAKGHCVSIQNGMDIDRMALADAIAKEETTFNNLAPHERYNEETKQMDNLEAEHRAIAFKEGEKVWQAECCVWSK